MSNEVDVDEVWHDVIDLQVWKMTSITDECFENDGGNRYMNSADIEGLITEVEQLRKNERELLSAIEEYQFIEEVTIVDMIKKMKKVLH